jgi:hypothetical protein
MHKLSSNGKFIDEILDADDGLKNSQAIEIIANYTCPIMELTSWFLKLDSKHWFYKF